MSDPLDALNALAAAAAAAYPGGSPYTYAAQDALTARILVVEEGGRALPQGTDLGAPSDDPTGKWAGVLADSGCEPGTYSWWNAIPCGLDRPTTAEDRGRGTAYLKRAMALHTDLHVVVAVGAVAQEVVKATRTNRTVLTSRSPLRSSGAQLQQICDTFVQARLYGYPLGV